MRIAASTETVWAHWTEPDRMAAWWGETEVSPEVNGAIRVQMPGGGPVMLGRYLVLDPPHHLSFSFGWEAHDVGTPLAPGSTVVDITLEADGADTVLTLVHRSMPATHAADHRRGWERHLPNLRATVERSVD